MDRPPPFVSNARTPRFRREREFVASDSTAGADVFLPFKIETANGASGWVSGLCR